MISLRDERVLSYIYKALEDEFGCCPIIPEDVLEEFKYLFFKIHDIHCVRHQRRCWICPGFEDLGLIIE